MGGPRGRKGAKVDPAKMEQYKEVCPPHKLKDLDALVKSLKGKDAEIMAKIQEWWEEPPTVEPEWENVDKKNKKKQPPQQQQQQQREPKSARGPARGGGGGGGRSGSTSRGGGRGSERRGRGDKRRSPAPTRSAPQEEQPQSKVEPLNNNSHDAPSPVVKAPAPKGAWGQRAAASAPAPLAAPASPIPTSPVTMNPVTPVKPQVPEPMPEVGGAVLQDPTPSGMNGSTLAATSTPSKPGGNVWATRGSAHLIRAEKPKPPPPPPPPSPPQQMRIPPSPVEPPQSPVVKEMALESGLPSTLSATSWNATTTAASIDITQSSTSVTDATIGSLPPEVPVVVVPQEPPPGSPVKPAPAPTNVFKMGKWESGEGDDSQNLDFGFGSFGPDNDAAAVEEPSTPSTMPQDTTATTVSPARPPPGLSLGGGGSMPPMPANAVLVHELENNLEGTSLKPQEEPSAPQPMTSNLPSQPPPPPGQAGVPPGVSQNYNAAYGGMGMYNYNNGGVSGFMGQQQGAPGALGVGPPPQKPGHQAPAGAPQHLQQAPPPGSLYGTAAPSSGAPGESSSAPLSTDTTASAIPPPGMPNAMAYNPALFYGQQPYQAMGQPHGGVAGYGYGYGAQFGAAGGFYGQQVMGQSGGYPSYDDQPPQGRDYASKGRNNYRNSGNQYQNQFNPQQHGGYGYGGQPMGGYDHFNQARGGYGHGPPTDAHGYGMPQQQQQGGSNYEGGNKKGGRFQQQHQQLGGGSSGHDQQQAQQQNPPFLGSNNASSSSNQGGTGWSNNNSNNNNQGGGGWGQPSSAWQGGN